MSTSTHSELPGPDAAFTIVTARFAFHHSLDPLADSLADDALDMPVRLDGDRIVFGGYPVAGLAARRR